jgi:hypothetical protein
VTRARKIYDPVALAPETGAVLATRESGLPAARKLNLAEAQLAEPAWLETALSHLLRRAAVCRGYICNGTTVNGFVIAGAYGPGASFSLTCGWPALLWPAGIGTVGNQAVVIPRASETWPQTVTGQVSFRRRRPGSDR